MVVRERRDVTEIAGRKADVPDIRDVTGIARVKVSVGRDVMLETVQGGRVQWGET